MSTLKLAETLWSDSDLRSTILAITVQTAASELPPSRSLPLLPQIKHDWFHLLRCASIFLEVGDERFHDRGLRILHSCLSLRASDDHRALAAALLAKATSNPSLDVAIKRALVPRDILDRLPANLSLEVASRQIAATVGIETPGEFVGSDFQGALWRALENYDWISASAPTSAGKSFVLKKWVEHAVRSLPHSTTFFIVPTRALISQVETDLREMLGNEYRTVNISSLPYSYSEPTDHNVFVYTQERFHLYLHKPGHTKTVDVIIVDEAQQFGAGQRGILLQQTLELAAHKYPMAKVLFASPSTSNPESLLEFAPVGTRTFAIQASRPTVNQNLMWVEQVAGRPTDWDIQLMADGEAIHVQRIALAHRPSTTQKLPFIAHAIGAASGGNVIYVNRASDAERVAEILCQLVKVKADDAELTALSELCEKAVHRKFRLRRFVLKGVAFHYGNIPQLIRTEVERLFSAGKIRFLVCTSTLVEGVNLSCRNIFMRNPRRGMKELMTPDDFWNLAGRAGRWGKEFHGNIYCIDPLHSREWHEGHAPRHKKKHTIRLATQRLASEFAEFSSFARNVEKRSESSRTHEYLLSYLISRRSRHASLEASPNAKFLTIDQSVELDQLVETTIDNLKIPIEIVLRNPGIDPRGMNSLYQYFMDKPEDEIVTLFPADPLSDAPTPDEEADDTAINSLIGVFTRITNHLGGKLRAGAAAYGNALLVAQWMRGYPLHRIIDRQIKYWSKRSPNKGSMAVIRETMEKVETIARFETPKYLHAYLDLLRCALEDRGRGDLMSQSDDYWLYLEFGVSKRTQLSLMALGLSRSSVTTISEYITEEDLSETECLNWLESNELDEYDLPQLVQLELAAVMKRYRRRIPAFGK